MGLNWSCETASEEEVKAAAETLDITVWDMSASLEGEAVKAVLDRHRVTCAADVDRVRGEIMSSEANNARRMKFYSEKRATDLQVHHIAIQNRYQDLVLVMKRLAVSLELHGWTPAAPRL